jgi:hypothetical protein
VRQALRRNPARQQVSIADTIPAPVGGLDTQSPLAGMPPTSAILLDNWTCRSGYIEMRRGYKPFATGLAGAVHSLISWRGSTTSKLFAGAGSSIYDVSAAGAVGAALVTGLSGTRWNYVNVRNAAGLTHVVAVNGADSPRLYDGTTWEPGDYTGTDLDASKWVDVVSLHNRLFFVERDSMRFWYLEPLAIQGAAVAFPLDEIFTKGGSLLTVGVWSAAAGTSLNARLVLITTEGEIAIYEGIDPGDAELWSLVGVYQVDTPIGRRCLVRNGADLGVLTSGGLVPLSQVLQLDRAAQGRTAFTQNVGSLFQEMAQSYGTLPGWQTLAWARGQLIIVNIPTVTNGRATQLVMDTVSGAWSRWVGHASLCWAAHNERLFFGTNGQVMEANVGWTDGNAPIVSDVQPAFNYFGSRGQQKRFLMLRPILRANQAIRPAIEMLCDFESKVPAATPTVADTSASAWDVAKWDTGRWVGERRARTEWTGITGIGACGSPRMRIATFGQLNKASIQLVGFDVLYELGGGL